MNEVNLKILNAIPLVEVMRGWGYVARREARSCATASYLCPWHDDHHPSLVVDKVVRDGATDLGFKCFACGEEGYGAIQLAARLMGFSAGKVPNEDLPQVLNELATRCEVELEPEEDGKIDFIDDETFYSDYMLEGSGKGFLYVGNIHDDRSVLMEKPRRTNR